MEIKLKKPSSNIASITYDLKSKTLGVKFIKNGRTYLYSDVPEAVAIELQDELSKGQSPGKTLNSLIIHAGYEYSEV